MNTQSPGAGSRSKFGGAYAELDLIAWGRLLCISIGREYRNVVVALYAEGDTNRNHMLVYATGDLREKREIRLTEETEGDPASLWVGRAAFDLTVGESEKVRELLAEFSAEAPR